MKKNCPYCGTELKETNYGNYWCPNHGIVYTKLKEPREINKEDLSYIG